MRLKKNLLTNMKLTLHDRNGVQLNFGDIVAISDGKQLKFYCRVTYLPDQKAIAPFHTFSFHSVIKVDSVPESAVKSEVEKRYDMWYDKEIIDYIEFEELMSALYVPE